MIRATLAVLLVATTAGARTGKRDAAIAAYRQALALNGNLFSSSDALQRLGASP
jgi:hypothetical protein